MLSVPAEHIADILRVAREREQRLVRIIDLCRDGRFSFDRLKAEIQELENVQ